jgi:hypothetical protein
MARLFKSDLEQPVAKIIHERVPAMIETVIGNMVPHLIEAAVLKGQMDLLDRLTAYSNQEARNFGEYDESIEGMASVFLKIHQELSRELDHHATTEHTPLTADEMHPDIADTPDNWDDIKGYPTTGFPGQPKGDSDEDSNT